MPEKVSVVTLGCEKNLVDSEIMSGLVHQRGYSLVDKPEDATVVIVNTCGFIDAAKEASVNTILSEIDGIVGTADFHRLNEIIDEALRGRKPVYVGNPVFNYEESMPRLLSTPRHTAYVKIAEGCDNACTFRSIPIMRGKFRSRSIESIVAEVHGLAAQGVKEISLIARRVRITHAYEYDLSGEGIA